MEPPRSGTTLLTVLLDRHSKICVTPESHFFHTLPREWFLHRGITHQKLIDSSIYGNHVYDFQLDQEQILNHFKKYPPTYANALRAAMEVFAQNQGKSIVGEKTATHMDHIAAILKWYPKAKIVWILRDGRDVAMGLMRHKHLHARIRRHCFTWRRLTRLGRYWQKQLPAETFYCIRYEELVNDPQAELQKLCQFLRVEYEPEVLDHNKASQAVLDSEMEHKGRALGKIDKSRIDVWKHSASSKQKNIMASVMAADLQKSGYQLDGLPKLGMFESCRQFCQNLPYGFLYNAWVYKTLKLIHHYTYKMGIKFNSFYRAQEG